MECIVQLIEDPIRLLLYQIVDVKPSMSTSILFAYVLVKSIHIEALVALTPHGAGNDTEKGGDCS